MNASQPVKSDWGIGEHILAALSWPVDNAERGGTVNANVDNALDFMDRTVPGFSAMCAGRLVLDYGCGWGWQALALQSRGAVVVGYDLPHCAGKWAGKPGPTFTSLLPEAQTLGPYDVVYSCSAFEHYANPEAELATMLRLAKPGGHVIVSFAEPWYSPRGAHYFTSVPWINLFFSEKTLLRVRRLYRSDGAQHFHEMEGGLNQLTVARFERIIRSADAEVELLKCYAVKGLPLVTQIPVLRELLTAAAAAILRKPS